MSRPRHAARATFGCALLLLGGTLSGCASVEPRVPGCTETARLALVAQSVPTSSYVPCLTDLPAGWSVTRFDAARGGTSFSLLSDRADGRPVEVRLQRRCTTTGASPEPPRTAGGRTYLLLAGISPRYAGTLLDVFPGGCVTYRFDFARGPHLALMEELFTTVDLLPRRQLRLELRQDLDLELDP
jgi:hypothetical protein